MSELPREGDIVVRQIPFAFPDDLDPLWSSHHEWSHMVNGTSLTMPYLEPFLIATLKEGIELTDDPAVKREARGFMAQEAQHYKTHRRYNELLKAHGYPELAEIEVAMERSYDRLRKRSLTYRLAYACGFETMTLGVTNWLISDRKALFGGTDTRVASFILWHFVEEAEHKRAAFDVYQAVRGQYWPRLLGVFTGSFHVLWWARKGTVAMLKADGRWHDWRSRLRLWRRTADFFRAALPVILRSASPWHDPRNEPDPPWVRDWIAGYAAADPGRAPLLDTDDPELPIPFAMKGAA
ncbi:MAG: metal-dependent hydrolase [Myxococcota bacterium]